jgi:hypothetical protein
MNEEQQGWINALEAAWTHPDGFLYKVRQGKYDANKGQEILADLSKIRLTDDEPVERRLVSLLWYIPSFLGWQKQRIIEKGGDVADYERMSAQAMNIIEEVLGVP